MQTSRRQKLSVGAGWERGIGKRDARPWCFCLSGFASPQCLSFGIAPIFLLRLEVDGLIAGRGSTVQHPVAVEFPAEYRLARRPSVLPAKSHRVLDRRAGPVHEYG